MGKAVVVNLWFNGNAREAVLYYMSIFKDARVIGSDCYTEVGEEVTGHKAGDVLTIEFELLGTKFIAINAGPEFTFNPSVSFMIACDTQAEIDYYWKALSAKPEAEQCGWLQDKYGLSWQIVPTQLSSMLKNGTAEQRKKVTERFMAMKKFEIDELEKAFSEARIV
jgi:predicted 3-demethylubiquinone-9 3-methyltransferase (glyoxalase superfamily)